MNIKRFGVEGLLSFKDKVTFELEPNTIYFVTGRNGSGKSTLFTESFAFLLDGKPYRDMAVKDIMNDESNFCSVWIETDEGDIIRRTKIDNRPKTVSGHSITLNGDNITHERLNNIIGMEKDLFFNSVIFGQGFGGFVYFKDKDKKEFITKLSLGFIDKYIDFILMEEKSISSSIVDIDEDVKNIHNVMSEIDVNNFKRLYNGYEQEILGNKMKNELSKKENIKRFDKLKKDMEKIEVEVEAKRKSLYDYNLKKKKLELEYKELNKKLKSIDMEIATVRANIDSNNEHINLLRSQKGIYRCHFCYSEIDSAKREYVISALKKDNSEIDKEFEIKYIKQGTALDDIKDVESTVRVIEECIDNVNKYLLDSSEDIRGVDRLISELEAKIENENKDNAENPYKNPYKDLYIEAMAKIKEYNSRIEEFSKKKKEGEGLLKGYKFWNEKLRYFKSIIFSDILNSLGILSNEYLEFLTDGKFGIKIDSKIKTTEKRIKDIFELEIIYKGAPESFWRLSGGEKRAVSLSVNIAFIQVISGYLAKDFNFIVLDEIFENLDEFTKDKVISLIQKLKTSTGKTIILITHDDFILDENSGVKHIEVFNQKGVSSIMELDEISGRAYYG